MTRTRTVAAIALTGAMAALGVGCTDPPRTPAQQEQFTQWLGTNIFGIIYIASCQANGGVCLFPIAPSLPVPPAT